KRIVKRKQRRLRLFILDVARLAFEAMAESPLLRHLAFALRSLDSQRFGLSTSGLLAVRAFLSQRFGFSTHRSLALRKLKHRFSRLSISSLQRVHNSCPLIWPYYDAINQHIHRLAEIDVQQ